MPGTPATAKGSIWALPGMLPLVVVAVTGFAGYAALLPVAPLWAVTGGADTAGAGLVNFVLLTATVATQFLVPRLIGTIGWGHAMAAGMVLLGVPGFAHGFSADLGATLALSGVRGIGFGILTVAASAAAVLVADPGRRGSAIGAYSLALSVPNVLLMPLGSWVAEAWSFWPVFVVAAAPVAGIPACYALARHLPERATHDPDHPAPDADPSASAWATLRVLAAPTAILLAITLAGGAVITFAPQVVTTGWLATAGLFALGLVGAGIRYAIGAVADRFGTGRLTWPFGAVAVVALLWLAWLARQPVGPADAVAWVLACALLGLAYGALQNLTMVWAFESAGPRRVGVASAVWNAGFDTGTAIGSVLVGAVAVGAGFGVGFAITAGLCLLTLPLALRAALLVLAEGSHRGPGAGTREPHDA